MKHDPVYLCHTYTRRRARAVSKGERSGIFSIANSRKQFYFKVIHVHGNLSSRDSIACHIPEMR